MPAIEILSPWKRVGIGDHWLSSLMRLTRRDMLTPHSCVASDSLKRSVLNGIAYSAIHASVPMLVSPSHTPSQSRLFWPSLKICPSRLAAAALRLKKKPERRSCKLSIDMLTRSFVAKLKSFFSSLMTMCAMSESKQMAPT